MKAFFFFFNDTATTEIYTLSLHDALPISAHAVPSAQLRDAVDGFERGDRVGSSGLPGSRLGGCRKGRERVADVEQHFEQQLLALVGRIEIRHAGLVAGRLRTLVGLAVDGLEIA